ncbi:MAG: iron chelate uptake ABC transporter family permease subunit, partial [Muribaculaceae bacterium]|nr:iron chelate uptake ABC transporter family permease subunit [Muribaculaceae bacterium]
LPHVARMIWRTSDHRILIPATMLTGSAVLLLCDIISRLLTLPVNAITALLGIPIVIYILLRPSNSKL